jgi:hypothetical protein
MQVEAGLKCSDQPSPVAVVTSDKIVQREADFKVLVEWI